MSPSVGLVIVFASIATTASVGAQTTSSSANSPVMVTVAESSNLPPGKHVTVHMQKGATTRNLVLLDSAATVDDLSAGLTLVGVLRKQFGDNLQQDLKAYPKPGMSRQIITAARRAEHAEFLKRLRTADRKMVPQVGVSRSVQVIVPPMRATPIVKASTKR